MHRLAQGMRAIKAFLFVTTALIAVSAQGEQRASLAVFPGTAIQPELKISYSLSTLGGGDLEAYRAVDLWQRIRAGFALEDVNPALVRIHEDWYRQHPAYLERAVERSRKYLFHIVDEVEKRGMPTEIALLPFIESAFNPQAVSPRKASGIWQFIPSTGRIYGLRQTAWYDGRRDVLEATRAALDYLEDLHAIFGRWDLALGAYNCGEGCMGRALGRNPGNVDYADLRLPTETKHYLPKLLAVRNIIKDPASYGIVLEDVANEPYFMQVTLNRHLEAQQVARLAEMSLDEVVSLNPGFQRKVIRSDHTGVLLLPTDRVETFTANLKRQEDKVGLNAYPARKGESLSAIADKFGVTLDWLKAHNPIQFYKGKLTQPTTVLVPGKARGKVADAAEKPLASPERLRSHKVGRGDTLTRLAELYGVEVADIRRHNNVAEPLVPGATLNIPQGNG